MVICVFVLLLTVVSLSDITSLYLKAITNFKTIYKLSLMSLYSIYVLCGFAILFHLVNKDSLATITLIAALITGCIGHYFFTKRLPIYNGTIESIMKHPLSNSIYETDLLYWLNYCDSKFFCVDNDLKFVFANKAYLSLIEHTLPQIKGRSWLDLIHQIDVASITNKVDPRNIKAKATPINLAYRYKNCEGETNRVKTKLIRLNGDILIGVVENI